MDVKWIKICTDIFDDEKVQLIEVMPESDGIIVIWFKLLCMAGKTNNNGVFMFNDKIAYTDEMLATIFRKPITIVRLALTTFEQFGMIEIVNGAITIPNWDKHQSIEKLEALKERNRLYMADYREKQKALADGKPKQKKFISPTVEDIQKYCEERQIVNFNCQAFIDYYEARGWMLSNNVHVKDWKACIRTWINKDPLKYKKKEIIKKGNRDF